MENPDYPLASGRWWVFKSDPPGGWRKGKEEGGREFVRRR